MLAIEPTAEWFEVAERRSALNWTLRRCSIWWKKTWGEKETTAG
jgi:hypothetical protein